MDHEQPFSLDDIHESEARAREEGVPSYERCGFTRDAVLAGRSYKDGVWHDRVIMSVTREGFGQDRLQRKASQE